MKKELTFFLNTDIIKNGHSKSSVDPWFWCNLQKCREVFRDVCCYMLSFQIVCCFHCLLFSLFAVFIWRVSEVVVTRRTRNAVVRKGTWVRIPHSPPSKNPVTMRVSGFFFFCARSKNHPILGCSFRNFGKNSFLLYAPLFSAFCSHLLPKSPASGSGIPLTIACAEESFEL